MQAMNIITKVHLAEQSIEAIFAKVCTENLLTVRRAVLLQAIEANSGVSQTTLCADTGIDRSTLATMINRLVQLHLVKRVRDKDDRRAYNITLTAAGKKLCAAGVRAIEDTTADLLRQYPKLKALA